MELGRRSRLELFALTDHDTIAGFLEAEASSLEGGPPVARGIEVSTRLGEVHVLGYGFKRDCAGFVGWVEELRRRRLVRVERILEKLRKLGLELSLEEVQALGRGVIGRPHVADALCRKKLASDRGEAFHLYLAHGRPAYVEPMGPSPEEAIGLIREAGGFASLAHPDTVEDPRMIGEWARLGLEGLEVYYGAYDPGAVSRLAKTAAGLGLLATGGSDAHGPGTSRDHDLGVEVPDAVYERFMERLSRCG